MKELTTINQTVTITAISFDKQFETVPKRMEYRGTTYNFVESGLRCLIRQGEKMVRILTLSDGQADFRLRSGENDTWTLLSISPRGI